MTASSCPPGPLGSWAEAHTETDRDGRPYRLLINHRTHQVLELSEAEARVCDQLNAGQGPGRTPVPPAADEAANEAANAATPAAAAFVAELHELGFLASNPPAQPRRRTFQLSLARLDLRWTGAGALVRAVHDRGARHLFGRTALAAQVVVALTGIAAVIAILAGGRTFSLRVHPAQIPLVAGVSLAAITVHELAHALVVVHHGRTVDAAGVRIHLGTPAFYVESADAVLLTRRQRLVQAAAGVWAEWLFTSVVAIWLWWAPLPFAGPMLHRFVILNAATIGTNLIPFTGLDGSWLLADALGLPGLSRRASGAVTRLLIMLAGRRPAGRPDRLLAAYAAANGLVAAGLLVTSGFFWYQLFGDLIGVALRHGPLGWLALAAGGAVLGRPAVAGVAARIPAAGRETAELCAAVRFRLQWRWRIPATARLATLPQLAGLSGAELGELAGHLHRTRCRGPLPSVLGASYGVVTAGAVVWAGRTGRPCPQPCPAGTAWTPGQPPGRAVGRATLVHVTAGTLQQILDGPARAAAAG